MCTLSCWHVTMMVHATPLNTVPMVEQCLRDACSGLGGFKGGGCSCRCTWWGCVCCQASQGSGLHDPCSTEGQACHQSFTDASFRVWCAMKQLLLLQRMNGWAVNTPRPTPWLQVDAPLRTAGLDSTPLYSVPPPVQREIDHDKNDATHKQPLALL